MRMFRRPTVLLTGVALAATVGTTVYLFPWSLTLWLVAGLYVILLLSEHRVRISLSVGYLRGRAEMVASLMEATNRGFTLEEWLVAEQERDISVFAANVLSKRERRQFKKDPNAYMAKMTSKPKPEPPG